MTVKTVQRVPVTERALVQRIKRALPPDQRLVKARGASFNFAVISDKDKDMVDVYADAESLVPLAKRLGVFRHWEVLISREPQ